MPEFRYAKGRIMESIVFITKEMGEFESDYNDKIWQEYSSDTKLQKLIDRTIENILTAVIETSGAMLTENDISSDSYQDVMQKIGGFFNFSKDEREALAKFAVQRNRLAHRYLNFRWQVVQYYKENRNILKKLINSMYNYEALEQRE
ncbi:MAG: DUF86 domain-containing protein [Deltaproteobacteria bacterium]|nr:DUF86 domain-containing protein [Deltaproteobacteria bacterium]